MIGELDILGRQLRLKGEVLENWETVIRQIVELGIGLGNAEPLHQAGVLACPRLLAQCRQLCGQVIGELGNWH